MTAAPHPDFGAGVRIAASDIKHTFTGASSAAASGSQLHVDNIADQHGTFHMLSSCFGGGWKNKAAFLSGCGHTRLLPAQDTVNIVPVLTLTSKVYIFVLPSEVVAVTGKLRCPLTIMVHTFSASVFETEPAPYQLGRGVSMACALLW